MGLLLIFHYPFLYRACKECCSCKNWIKDYEAEEKSDRFICRSCSSWVRINQEELYLLTAARSVVQT